MNKTIKTILRIVGLLVFLSAMLIAATMFYFEPVDNTSNVSLSELSKVNDQIIAYFQNPDVAYDNYSYNYVDEQNKVVVVGLLNNTKEEQDRFKEIVVNSDYIKFVKGERLKDY